ncbi:MAG: GtrA family protein [Erysipelotrichaceae bacterium]|nr:GtrA family protein [Erysipelotrichaceae bacterium]
MIELLKKYREQISYLFFGGCTFLVSMVTFYLFSKVMGMSETVANIPSNVIAILFAYITNKLFVFQKKNDDKQGLLKEFISFLGGRAVTFLLEELIIFVGVDLLHIDGMIVKLIAQVVVILGNYFISKFFVFKKSE